MFTSQALPPAVPSILPGLGAIVAGLRRRYRRARRYTSPMRPVPTVRRLPRLRQQLLGQPPWCPWSKRWDRSGLSSGSPVNMNPVEQRMRLLPAAYTAAVEEKQTPIVSQGRWMQSPAPGLAATMARRKRVLMTSPARLPVRGFATRFKHETMQRINRIPSSNIPGEAVVNEPNYVRNVEVIAFAEAPVGSLDRGGDRDGRYRMEGSGFLRSHLSF